MANLSKLTLAPRPAPVKSDPFEAAKAKLLKNLDGQLTSARAMLDGKLCPEVKRKWYHRDGDGKVRLRLRVGPSVLDMGNGMTRVCGLRAYLGRSGGGRALKSLEYWRRRGGLARKSVGTRIGGFRST